MPTIGTMSIVGLLCFILLILCYLLDRRYCHIIVELSNTQLALQGTDTEGFVIVTSAMSRVLNYEHKPQWREGDLRIKKSWVAKVEEMQVSKFIFKPGTHWPASGFLNVFKLSKSK